MPRVRFAKRVKIIVDENNPCPLLQKLPIEIRMAIWQYLLAGQVIHAQQRTTCSQELDIWQRYELTKILDCSEAIDRHPKAHNIFSLVDSSALDIVSQQEHIRHHWRNGMVAHARSCTGAQVIDDDDISAPTTTTTPPPPPSRPETSILRTCRKIYHETHNIFWSRNTFSFDSNPKYFHDFVSALPPSQRKLLTTVHFSYDVDFFIQTLRREVLADLPNLRELHFTLHLRDVSRTPTGQITIDHRSWTPFFSWFQCLGLEPKRVSVVTSTQLKYYVPDRLSLREAVEIAEHVRNLIVPGPAPEEEDRGTQQQQQQGPGSNPSPRPTKRIKK